MSDDEEHILEEEPLRVLGMFARRDIDLITFDVAKYQKLYNCLKCTICSELCSQPVYLRCSHRFCKVCLEKYIRFSDKKSCPNCRGVLTTKRDLRQDYSISSLINFSFGDHQKFTQGLTKVEEKEIEMRMKIKSDSRKKVKPNENLDDIANGKQAEAIDHESNFKKPKRRGSRKNSKKRIYNRKQSQSDEHPNNIVASHEKTTPKKQEPKEDVEAIQSAKILAPTIALSVDEELQHAKEDLMSELGKDYLSQLIKHEGTDCRLSVSFKKKPGQFLTPQLSIRGAYLPAHTTIGKLRAFLAQQLNLRPGALRISAVWNDGQIQLQNDAEYIYQINETYWKSVQGLDAYNLSEMLEHFCREEFQEPPNVLTASRLLYYWINPSTFRQ